MARPGQQLAPARAPWRRVAAAGTLIREFGLGLAAVHVVHRLLLALSGGRARLVPYVLVAQPIGAGAYEAVRDDPGTVVTAVDPDDPSLADIPRPAAVIAARLASGSRCHLATVKGRYAGMVWISRGKYTEDEVRCEYRLADPATCVWDFDVYVEPNLRLGRTMGRLWKAVDAHLAAEGKQWAFSRISRFNRASLASHARLGAVEVGRLTFLVLGPVQLTWQSLPSGTRASWGTRDMPSILLRPPTR